MDVKSEMAANVWQVYVEPGQKVAEGDTLMMLEIDENGNSGGCSGGGHRDLRSG